MLSDVTEEADMTFGSLQTEVALGLATRAILTNGFWSRVILKIFFESFLQKELDKTLTLEETSSDRVYFVHLLIITGQESFLSRWSKKD